MDSPVLVQFDRFHLPNLLTLGPSTTCGDMARFIEGTPGRVVRNWANQPDAKAKRNERRLELEGIDLAVPRPERKGRLTMSEYDRPLPPTEIAAVKDENIDLSEIPELDETFWRQAELVEPDLTEQVTICVRRSVLA